MARSLDQAQTEAMAQATEGVEVSGDDTEIAVRMTIQLLNDANGLKLIEDAINQSQDPAMVIGQFLAQIIGQLSETLGEQINLDPRVFLAKGGWLDAILAYIEAKLGYPEEFSDQVYGATLETIKAAAMGPQAPNQVMGGPEQQGAMPAEAPLPAQPGIPQAGGMR